MSEESIGSKIRKLRRENKDTLKSLSEKIDFDFSNLSKVERGKYGVSHELLQSLVDLYGVDPKYFFGGNFTEAEGKVLLEEDLSPSALKEKYHFNVDGTDATEEEIMEAVRLIRLVRPAED